MSLYEWEVVLRVSKLAFFDTSWPSAGCTPNKSSSPVGFICTFLGLLRTRLANDLNSNSVKISSSFVLSGSTRFKSSILISTGTSVRMVARNFDILISSTAPSTFSRSLPFTWEEFSIRPSTLPNSLISLMAVFSPTPGQPGKLSAESPIRARRSITWSGEVMLYFSSISCTPNFSYPPPWRGRNMKTLLRTSCA